MRVVPKNVDETLTCDLRLRLDTYDFAKCPKIAKEWILLNEAYISITGIGNITDILCLHNNVRI